MKPSEDARAWLETPTGARLDLLANCSLGRVAGNDIVVESQEASRRHAVIHLQNLGEFWLIDLGSTNGTFLNSRRVHKPARLCNDDEITIGGKHFKFQQPQQFSSEFKTTFVEQTIRGIHHVNCWLLLADIEDFTPLSTETSFDALAVLLGEWMSACKDIIESQGGAINKYLGDGLLAYWKDNAEAPEQIVRALQAFKQRQKNAEPKFRIVVHHGRIAVGGIVSMGEESLMGTEVNLLFRLEKVAAALRAHAVVSGSANDRLAGLITSRSLGTHAVKGFNTEYGLFAV